MIACEHPGFKASVAVGRLTDEAGKLLGYTADVHVECAECALPFEFVGMPLGVSPAHPTMSPDALEARLPLVPQRGSHLKGPLWPRPRLAIRND